MRQRLVKHGQLGNDSILDHGRFGQNILQLQQDLVYIQFRHGIHPVDVRSA